VVVNNAGILRDRVLVNLSDDDWDLVVRVSLRGTFLVTRAAAQHWRDAAKAGAAVAASVINVSSESGVFGNPGQANYAAAKAGVASLTQVAAKELARYGVRVNAILPQARTRMTESAFGDALAPKEGKFDRFHPGNVSPTVVWLAMQDCPISGEVFLVGGSRVQRVKSWEKDPEWKLDTAGRWTVEELAKAAAAAGVPAGSAWTANPEKS
jgi:NAD(P)-dependent dehydrogenase (short-subunit alcohol dehydrogenase family)